MAFGNVYALPQIALNLSLCHSPEVFKQKEGVGEREQTAGAGTARLSEGKGLSRFYETKRFFSYFPIVVNPNRLNLLW